MLIQKKPILKSLSRIAIATYAAVFVLLYFFQDRIIFHPQPLLGKSLDIVQFGVTYKNKSITLHGWKVNSGKKNLLIYYGGNAEELSTYIAYYKKLEDYTALLINYRGYGKSSGTPSEEALFEDALLIYDQVKDEGYDKIILVGRSLGSGVAVYVAGKREVDGIILITPYDSILNVAKERYFMFPVSLLLKHPFNSLEYAENIKCPTLMLIAENDEVISHERTDNLINHWKSPIQKIIVAGSDHNSITDFPPCWEESEKFMKDIIK
jgi:uncharacterized protein